MNKYIENKEIEEVAKKVLPLMTEWADIPTIKYLEFTAEKSSYAGKCSRATGKWEYLTEVDYVIEVWTNFWATATNSQKEALLYHELNHIESEENDAGEITWKIRKHDIEEFEEVVAKYGAWNEPLRELLDAHIEYEATKKEI